MTTSLSSIARGSSVTTHRQSVGAQALLYSNRNPETRTTLFASELVGLAAYIDFSPTSLVLLSLPQ